MIFQWILVESAGFYWVHILVNTRTPALFNVLIFEKENRLSVLRIILESHDGLKKSTKWS